MLSVPPDNPITERLSEVRNRRHPRWRNGSFFLDLLIFILYPFSTIDFSSISTNNIFPRSLDLLCSTNNIFFFQLVDIFHAINFREKYFSRNQYSSFREKWNNHFSRNYLILSMIFHASNHFSRKLLILSMIFYANSYRSYFLSETFPRNNPIN